MVIGTLTSNIKPIQEGFFSSVGKAFAKLFSSPSVTKKLQEALEEAKEEGRAYDVRYIKRLLELRKKKANELTDAEEAEVYLLMKAYINLPDALSNQKSANSMNNLIWLVNDMHNSSKISNLEKELTNQKLQTSYYRNRYYNR